MDVVLPWVRDAASCAEFLLAIFPSLKYLRGPSADYDHTNLSPKTELWRTWANVIRLIREGVATGADEGTTTKPSAAALGDMEDDGADYYYDSGRDEEGSDELF